MREEEVEAGGGYDELSFQLPPQEESMPATESEDAVMSDQALTEVQSQAQPLNDVVDLQLTTNDEIESHSDRKLINNLRAQSRKTVVTMKTQIESLMVQVNVLVNQLGDADLDQQKCEHKLRNTQAQLATTRKALESSKAKRKRQNGMVQGLRANLKETKAIVHSVQATNSDLQDELAASQEALSSCRDDLFSLQPLAPVADSSIVQELEIISQEVVHWIETEVAAFENAHPEAEPEQIFSVGNDKEVASFLQKYPAAGEHLARYLVHRFFQATLYGKGFDFLGLKKETAQLLQKAEHSMAKRDPPRGTSALDNEVSIAATNN